MGHSLKHKIICFLNGGKQARKLKHLCHCLDEIMCLLNIR